MRITRSTLRRLIAEESARLLREAAEEEEVATNEAERGKKGKKRGGDDCLYVLYGGRGVYYYTAPCGLSEEEAAEKGHDVTDDVVGGEDMADPLSLYDWLQRHDEITAVYDDESAGGEVSKDEFMGQLRDVGEEEGLFASDDDVNESDEPLDETDDLDEMTDDAYNDDLQSRHGRFTTPEDVKGTPQYGRDPSQARKPEPGIYYPQGYAPSGRSGSGSGYASRRSEWGDDDLYGGPPRVDEAAGREDEVDCLYILKRGGQYVYIVARPYIDDAAELEETGNDITDMIMAQGPAARDANVYEFLSSNPRCAVVRVRGAYEMAEDYMMNLEDNLGVSTGPVYEGAFPEEIEGVYGEEPPDEDEDYEDDSWMDYETGEDDVPFGAADVALRQGRGHRTDEGDDSNWDDDLRAQSEYQHALDVGPEVAYADYDTGDRNAFTQRGLKGRGPAPRISGDDFDSGEDEVSGGEAAMADYEHAWNIGGGSDEEGFAADYDTGGRNKFTKMGMRGRGGLSEARWAKLAGILKG